MHKNQSGLSDVWRTEENVEIKYNIDKNKKETVRNTGYTSQKPIGLL